MIGIPECGQRPLIMGIVNVTPDSFSGDGVITTNAAIAQGVQMVSDGADLLDIGGESTRPGATPVDVVAEIQRVVPVVAGLRQAGIKVPISLDTMKAAVAATGLDAGATIINDVTGGVFDPAILRVAAERKVPIVLMHNRSESQLVLQHEKIGGEYAAADYQDIVQDVGNDLLQLAARAVAAGVAKDQIILDPGIGFGKSVEQNLQLIAATGTLKQLGYPLLLGMSRKSFIGRVLNLSPEDRLEGTAACVALAAYLGADILRVHDVKAMARVAKMAGAVSTNN